MLRDELHGQAATDASLAVNLIGFTAGFLIASLLLALTLRASRLPGTPSANIVFALCGLVWNAAGLIHAFALVSGMVVPDRLLLLTESAHFFGALLWALPILAIWRPFAVLPWQKTAARLLRVVAYISAAATGILLWAAVLGARRHLFYALFSIAIYQVALLLLLGAAICLRRATTPRAVFLSSWVIVGAVCFSALAFATGGHVSAHRGHGASMMAAAQQVPLLIVLSGFFLFARFRFGDIFIRYSVRIWLAALAATLLAVAAQGHRPVRIVTNGDFPTVHIFGVTLLAGGLLLSFTFIDARLARLINHWFFHTADYRIRTRELAEKLRPLEQEAEIAAAVEESACRTLELSGARIVACDDLPASARPASLQDGEIVERERSYELLVPIASGGRISHLLLVSPSPARPGLVTQELNFLRTLATQCGQRMDALRLERETVERRSREAVLLQQVTEAELRALRSQVNPHFLFNSLNTIADLIVRDPPRAEAMTLRLAGVFRHVLANTSRPLTSIRDEMEFLRTYLSIEEARFGDRLQIAFDVPAEAAAIQIPSLILQPLVENALKHGLGPKPGPGHLWISARMEGDEVRLQIEDDGMGLPASPPQGLGLANVRERLRTLYQDRGRLCLEPREAGGTRATVTIPCTGRGPA